MGKLFEAMRSEKQEKVTITLTLDTRKSVDEIPVAVRVNYDRQNYYYRTGHKCTLEEWEKLCKASGKGKAMLGKLYQNKLTQIRAFEKVSACVKNMITNDCFSMDGLKTALTGKAPTTLNDLWREVAQSKKIGTKDSYITACNSFSKHIGQEVSFNKVGVSLIEQWKKKMEDDGLSNTSIGIYFRACRVILKEGIKRGFIKPSQYPFGKENVKIKKGRSRIGEFLTISEIIQLKNFSAPDNWREGYADAVYQAIDLWMFSYFGNGMNLADMALLTWNDHYFSSDQTELCFIRKKTADTTDSDIEIIVPITDELRIILDRIASKPESGKLIFPFLLEGKNNQVEARKAITQWNSNIQDRVIAACKVVGINKNVSMTWARHSFATNLTYAGVSERYISQAMGHSVKNVTQGYIGLYPPDKRMEFNKKLITG